VTSLALHFLCVVLVFGTGRRIGLSYGAAWLAALLFAVYPLGTRAVGHVADREETLALALLLAAFLLHASGRWIYEPAALVFLTAALFCAGYLAVAWLALRRRGRALFAVVALPALWLPVETLFFGRAFDLTHNLYAPSVAFALLLALVVERAGFEGRAGNLRH